MSVYLAMKPAHVLLLGTNGYKCLGHEDGDLNPPALLEETTYLKYTKPIIISIAWMLSVLCPFQAATRLDF